MPVRTGMSSVCSWRHFESSVHSSFPRVNCSTLEVQRQRKLESRYEFWHVEHLKGNSSVGDFRHNLSNLFDNYSYFSYLYIDNDFHLFFFAFYFLLDCSPYLFMPLYFTLMRMSISFHMHCMLLLFLFFVSVDILTNKVYIKEPDAADIKRSRPRHISHRSEHVLDVQRCNARNCRMHHDTQFVWYALFIGSQCSFFIVFVTPS